MGEFKYKVYVQVDENKVIKSINSDIFIQDLTNWMQIDEGTGDKFALAQGNYLDKGLIDANNKYNYKLVDNKPVELTDEEKESLFSTPVPQPTLEEKESLFSTPVPQPTLEEKNRADIDYILVMQGL